MGAINRRYPALSPEALATLPEVIDFLEETAKGARLKAARDGLHVAVYVLRQEVENDES